MAAPGDAPVAGVLAHAQALEQEGDPIAAIDALTAANRERRDGAIERELVHLRHRAFFATRGLTPQPVAPDGPAMAPADGRRTIAREELTPEALAGGIAESGYVHVPGLVDAVDAAALVDGVDRAFDALAAHRSGDGGPRDGWYEPFPAASEYKLGIKRKWVVDNGGVWTADSPPMLFALLEAYRTTGLLDTIAAHLGERPALSVNKSTLKRIDGSTGGEWHQDGAFLGQGIKTVNVWLSLSHCGRDAPGLDLVPARFDHVLETGTDGAAFDWAVGPGLVERVATERPVIRPEFEPGDALLFDELFLHRTAAEPSMPRVRYAIETWFFAPSVYPDGLTPLLV